ncbi:unnamed protein product [Closterium sp. NIES-53]
MLAMCREHRLEHRTKHIALRYFLARELQQRGPLRLAYVASQANTADLFTKALPPGDHQRFCTMLAYFALFDWSCDLLFSPTLPMRLHLRRCRLRHLHPNRHRHLHLYRCHRSPHLCHHPHPHPLLRLHHHYLLPRHLLQRPCPACPCRCGACR